MVRARHTADPGALGRGGHAISGAIVTPDEPTLDQLFAEPIVQQLMIRDRIDEATTRNLLQQAAAAYRSLAACGHHRMRGRRSDRQSVIGARTDVSVIGHK